VLKLWDEALEEYETVLYIPISSGLSGSCQTAMMMAQEEPYCGRVFVVDNGRVSTPLHRSVLDALELIEEGYSAAGIKAILEEARDKMVIYIGVQTLEHLKQGGRITPATAALGTVLNIKPVLKFDVGNLDTFKKCRGFNKARRVMIEAMEHDLNTRFKEWYDRGEVYLLAASSASQEETESWVAEIKEAFPGMEVMCDDLSLGVSCHIGQGGLGIGCSVRPERPQKA
jgi:DegV family protein with EDD domain